MNAVKIAKSQNKCIFHVRLRKLSHKFLILQSRNYIAKQKQNIILLQTKKMAKKKKKKGFKIEERMQSCLEAMTMLLRA